MICTSLIGRGSDYIYIYICYFNFNSLFMLMMVPSVLVI